MSDTTPDCALCIHVKHEGENSQDLVCLKHKVKLPRFGAYIICRDYCDIDPRLDAFYHDWVQRWFPEKDVLYKHSGGYGPPEIVAPFTDLDPI